MRKLALLLIILIASCEAPTTGVSEADSNTFEKNVEKVILSYKPPIFWKEKDILKENTQNKILIKELNQKITHKDQNIQRLNRENFNLKAKNEKFEESETQIKELKSFISELEDEKSKVLSELNESKKKDIIIKSKEENLFLLTIPSSIKGSHVFYREVDFESTDILNCQAIAMQIDQSCPDQDPSVMEGVFEANIKKYLNRRIDNRTFRKQRTHYKFSS